MKDEKKARIILIKINVGINEKRGLQVKKFRIADLVQNSDN
jgi:hypothetical protein